MRRERSGPGLTEHLLQVEILLGHVRQAPHLILQHRTRHRKTSRHKTRGIAGSTPLRHVLRPQSTRGLCWVSQGWPNTTGARGEWVTRNVMVSEWLPEVTRVMGTVERLIPGSDCPLRALTEILWRRGTKGMWRSWARDMSKRLPSAPESSSAVPHVARPPIATSPGGGWWMRLCWEIPHPTVASDLLSGLVFYGALHQEMASRATVQT